MTAEQVVNRLEKLAKYYYKIGSRDHAGELAAENLKQ